MRVLVVATDHPPHRAGGYELQCAGAVAHLRSHGHEVRILTSAREGGPPDEDPGVHRDLVRFAAVPGPVGAARAAWAERRNARALGAHLLDHGADVVSWWRLGELSMSLPGRARAARVPGVGMVCDPWMLDGPERDPWARRTGAGPELGAARWLFVSRALREQVGGTGDVVPAGIDLGAFAPAPPRPWAWRLLYAGRLSRLKGVDTAIAALPALPGTATLRIVGDGDPAYAAELRALAARLGVAGRVTFDPAVAPAAMAAVHAAADAVLFPVRWAEPWGLVPLEAMAVGRPVVATGTGGSGEYLRDGTNALLHAPDDLAALADRLGRLAAEPRLRERLRAAGRATAERHPAETSHAAVRQALEAAARSRAISLSA